MKKMTVQERNDMIVLMNERQRVMAENIELIYAEVKRTNGRVTKIENWQAGIRGVWLALAIVTPIVGTIIGYVVQAIFH